MSRYDDIKNGLLVLFVPSAIIAGVICRHMSARVGELESRLQQTSIELAHTRIPMQRDTIHDSIPVVTQTVVEVVPRRLKEALAGQEQTIRDLRLKVQQLEAAQTTTIKTSETVRAEYQPGDSCFRYSDQWADLSLRLKDTTFYYNIRDSLATYVYREYRHRFLWWRWGTKGYRVKMVNFNPHATVIYNQYVRTEK